MQTLAVDPNSRDRPVPEGVAPDFESLYAQHFQFVWRCLRSLGVPARALDDAAQDVFVTVHHRLPSFRGDSKLSTWVFGITRHVAARHRRTAQRKERWEPLEGETPSQAPGPLEQAQDQQARDFILGFLERLDVEKREVFVLAMLENLPVPDVAEMLEIPINTAYSRLRRARTEFQRQIDLRGRR